jgi:hypothetical protein
MNNDIQLLTELRDSTTAVRIEDGQTHAVILEDTLDQQGDPQFLQEKAVYDFSSLNTNWENKWRSFGDVWTHERQMFRYLWYEVNAFAESYLSYKENYHASLNLAFRRDRASRERLLKFQLKSELSLRSMYEYGKQAIDLLYDLSGLNNGIQAFIQDPARDLFLRKFKETRNKFLIHYFEPYHFPDWLFESIFSSVNGTGSMLEIEIHVRDRTESRYLISINHYTDYFKLEEVFVSLISSF